LLCSPKFGGRKRGAELIKHFSFKIGSSFVQQLRPVFLLSAAVGARGISSLLKSSCSPACPRLLMLSNVNLPAVRQESGPMKVAMI